MDTVREGDTLTMSQRQGAFLPPEPAMLQASKFLSVVAGGGLKTEVQPIILVTTVDIGGGKSDKIEIRRGDDPADLARAFCDRHSLPEGVLGPLTEHLLDNLRKASKSISVSQVRSAMCMHKPAYSCIIEVHGYMAEIFGSDPTSGTSRCQLKCSQPPSSHANDRVPHAAAPATAG